MEALNTFNIALQIAGTLGLSILGMLFAAFINANTSPNTGKFTFFIFWRDNAQGFLWAIFGMLIIITILCLVPESSEFLSFIGFSIKIPMDGVGALTLGGFIYEYARKKFKTQK